MCLFSIGCCIVAICVSATYGDDEDTSQRSEEVASQLLEGLDDLPPLRSNPSADIAGEDLGAAQPKSTLPGLARLMQEVEQRLRRDDTSAATTQLQSDIAMELARMLKNAEQQNASRSSASAANEASNQAGKTNADGSDGDPQSRDRDDSTEPDDLLEAIWGTLPAQLRGQIQSPLQEEFLPRYERVIKQYYKRLAEEQRRLRN